MKQLWAIEWWEHDEGSVRPDDVSYHLSAADAKAFANDVLTRQHGRFLLNGGKQGQVPSCYTRPEDEKLVEVSESLWRKVTYEGEFWGTCAQTKRLHLAKTAQVDHECRKHEWTTGQATAIGFCVNCGVGSWEFMVVPIEE